MSEESSTSSVNGAQANIHPQNKGYQTDIINIYFMH
jgi:hypothetical protein